MLNPAQAITDAIRLCESCRDIIASGDDAESLAKFEELIVSLYAARGIFLEQRAELEQLRARVAELDRGREPGPLPERRVDGRPNRT